MVIRHRMLGGHGGRGTMLVVTWVLLSGLAGCRFGPRSIDSLKHIDQYPTTVTVEGVVGDRIPLIDQYVYELEDSSGRIWVQTSTLPDVSAEQRVQVKGDLLRYSMSDLGNGYSELLLQELSHRAIE